MNHYFKLVIALIFIAVSCTQAPKTNETNSENLTSSDDNSTMIQDSLISYLDENVIKLVGEWKAINKNGKESTFIFDSLNNVKMIDGNNVIMSQKYMDGEGQLDIKFELDSKKDPIWFDLIFLASKIDELKKLRAKGIMRFVTNDKIEWRIQMDTDKERFTNFSFDDDRHTILLTRVAQ